MCVVSCASTSDLSARSSVSPSYQSDEDGGSSALAHTESTRAGAVQMSVVGTPITASIEAKPKDDKEPYLKTLCDRGDLDAVRVHRASFTKALEEPSLVRCWATALLDAGRLNKAREVVAPLLDRSDEEGNLSRKLLSTHFERLGRWALIRALYEDRDLRSDPEGIRFLGIAYRKLGEPERLNELLPSRRPSTDDPWRWLWWLRELEARALPEPKELESLLRALEQSDETSEGATLRPLLVQALRRGEWFVAAQQCVERAAQNENEVVALNMSRTSISAALQGDVGLWEVSLSCALSLAQLTTSPEATCQEIHLEQMDWEVLKKLGSSVKVYPGSGDCGRENIKVRKWLERWAGDSSSGASS